MKESGLRSLVLIAGLSILTLGYQNCSQVNTFSSKAPPSATNQSSFANNGGTTTDNPKPTIDLTMGGFDPIDVQNADLCLGQITVSNSNSESSNSGSESSGHSKTGDIFALVFGTLLKSSYSSSSSSSSRFSQSLGNQPVTALPSGTYLQPIMIPAGTYDQVEIKLSDNCNKTSMAIQNRNGRIVIRKDVKMRFTGSLTIYPGDPQLRLNLAPIMSALSNARDSKDAEDALDRTDGGL